MAPSASDPASRDADGGEVRARLDQIAERAESALRQTRVARRSTELVEHGLLILFLVPAVLWLVIVTQWAFGPEPIDLSIGVVLLAAAIPALWYTLVRGALVYFRPVERKTSLALADQQLDLNDRLTTADEFLERRDRDGFMQAAIEDAEQHLARATASEFRSPRTAIAPLRARGWVFASLALLAVIGIAWFEISSTDSANAGSHRTVGKGAPVEPEDRDDETRTARDTVTATPPRPKEGATETAASRQNTERYDASRNEETKDVRGKTGTGQSSEAAKASGMSESQGTPSEQGQVAKSDPKKAKPPKKKRKKEPAKPKPTEKKEQPNDASGRTAGLGSGRGSNRNPTATPWSSKDRVENVDDEDLEQEDDVDDEAEESESRGGMQPTLRDRKPPVSRDLSPSFGNRPNPNAKDRGGPSAQKKSRGTASLVLGVPIPDQVKGQPNPGRTKITQEQIQPRSEETVPVDASERTSRSESIGPWNRMSLRPWMRDLVKDYFLHLRNSEESQR
ncbi:MAG: hypothetical protein AAF488_08160 [Planctomycetota bacterium]